MKVPKYIREKMHRVARYHAIAIAEMYDVENWFENKGFNIEALRHGNGESLEELDYGNDVTDVFCDRIEGGEYRCSQKG